MSAEQQTKVLVTTASGTVGQWVVKFLGEHKDQIQVYGCVRDVNTDGAKILQRLGATLVQVDTTSIESMASAVEGKDKIVFITPLVEAHQEITEKWIHAFEQHKQNIKHITRLSIITANDPKFQMAEWHAVNEVLLKNTEIPTTILRPGLFSQGIGNYYGPTMKARKIHCVPLGDAAISYVDARDVARAIVKVVSSSNDEYKDGTISLQGARAYTQQQVCDIISQATGEEIKYVDIDRDTAYEALINAHVPVVLAELSCDINTVAKENPLVFAQSNDDIKNILGNDAISLEKYVKDHIYQFK